MAIPAQQAREEMQAVLRRSRGKHGPTAGGDNLLSSLTPAEIVEALTPFLTERRRFRIETVLDGRTLTVVPVVEGIVNTGNINAVMRSAEALGYQRFDVIKNDPKGTTRYKSSRRTSQGAEKWLDVHLWETAAPAAAALRQEGYRIVVTHLSDEAVPIDEIDFTKKTALVFGNEKEGVTEAMLEEADAQCIIPIEGFTQSYNISVAAAISLYHAYRDRMQRQGFHGDLTEAQKELFRAAYYVRSVNRVEEILREIVG